MSLPPPTFLKINEADMALLSVEGHIVPHMDGSYELTDLGARVLSATIQRLADEGQAA